MISVIVPVYKVEKYLDRCVESILAQTFTDFELILVDDGSPDNCPQMCDNWAKKDSRIVVIHQPNGGLSAARNAGIDWAFANSDSQWLTFIDSDDWIHPQTFERLYNAAVENNVSVSVCGYELTPGESPYVDDKTFQAELREVEEFYINKNVNATVAWGKLYKKECFEELRYPVGKIHEDEFLTYKILFKYKTIAYIPAPLYAYFENTEGIMRTDWSPKRLASVEAIEEHINYFLDNCYNDAYLFACKRYIDNICMHLTKIENSKTSEKFLKEKKFLIKKGRKAIRQYKKISSFTIEENIWIYELLHPTRMRFYWYGKAIKRKLTGGK